MSVCLKAAVETNVSSELKASVGVWLIFCIYFLVFAVYIRVGVEAAFGAYP